MGAVKRKRDGLKTFWTDPNGLVRVSLRRFYHTPAPGDEDGPDRRRCVAGRWGCDASTVIHAEAPRAEWIDEDAEGHYRVRTERIPPRAHDDWPTKCEGCGIAFGARGEWQLNAHPLYEGGGHVFTLQDPPPGAMYDAHWMGEWFRGADGICLVVITPDGHPWSVDGEASNCKRPGDRAHRCWCRHGDPRTEPVTVDKNCVTCKAGAGSIQTAKWHGHLRNGHLVV